MTAEMARPRPGETGGDAKQNSSTQPDDKTSSLTYRDTAPDYYERGWQPLPLFSGKGVTPPGMTGYAGALATPEDVERWRKSTSVKGLCLRLVDGVGLDLDAYDPSKNAADSWARLTAELGPLPPTWLSSSRLSSVDYDGLSGIRLYKLPPKYAARQRERCWKGNLAPGIDVVRFAHRQVNAWPTMHKRGTQYEWLNEATGEIVNGVLPVRPEDIPELPEAWCETLLKPEHPAAGKQHKSPPNGPAKPTKQVPASTPGERAVVESWWTVGHACPAVMKALEDLLDRLTGNRHDTAVSGMLRLTRLGEQGHLGVLDAMGELRDAFIMEREGDEELSEPPEDEWSRAEAGIYAQIAAKGFTSPANKGCCGPTGFGGGHDYRGLFDHDDDNVPVDNSATEDDEATPGAEDGPGDGPESTFIADDESFWERRPFLTRARDYARASRVPVWSFLGCTLGRIVCSVGPHVVLPALRGGYGSLNLFVAVCGESAAGKSTSIEASESFLATSGGGGYHVTGPGTGEGLIGSFVHRKKGSMPVEMVQHHVSVFYDVDEVSQLDKLMNRQGATFVPTLTSGWSGRKLSNTNADPDKLRWVEGHAYRLVMACGVQPENSGCILDETATGFPQRWLWLPTYDAGLLPLGVVEALPEAWHWSPPASWQAPGLPVGRIVLTVCQAIVEAVHEAQEANNVRIGRRRSRRAKLDGHAVFTRLKVAAALALVEGRLQVNDEDWELAGHVMRVSAETRAAVERARGQARADEEDSRAKRQGRSAVIASDTATGVRVVRAMDIIRTALARREGEHSHNALLRFAGSRYRDVSDEAIERMVSSGELIAEDSVSGNRKSATYYRAAVKKP